MTKANIKYIVIHSTKSIPGGLPLKTDFNFLIASDGIIMYPEKRLVDAGCISLAYTGGLNENGQPENTMNKRQETALFELISELAMRYRRAVVRGANELYCDPRDTGFDLSAWLKSYKPGQERLIASAAMAA